VNAAESVTVRVPGSTSNCGAGFDTLGLALNVYNRVTVTRAPGPDARPERAGDARAQAMVCDAAAAYFAAAGADRQGFTYRIEGEVPPARGLGSSVTVIAGIVAGLDALHGSGLGRRRIVEITAAIEAHPDNASAGVLGGFCVSRSDPETGAYLDTIRFEVPAELAFAVASPSVELLTKESRGALPVSVGYFDAVRSVNAAAYLVAAFASRDYARLRHAAGDFLHEPYRLARIPGGRAAIEAGIESGAWTGWLSGSGSSVLCVCERASAARVMAAMQAAFGRASMACEGRILEADNDGLRLEGP
jgi:homoserine kinase